MTGATKVSVYTLHRYPRSIDSGRAGFVSHPALEKLTIDVGLDEHCHCKSCSVGTLQV